jgi:hypothetical protein
MENTSAVYMFQSTHYLLRILQLSNTEISTPMELTMLFKMCLN